MKGISRPSPELKIRRILVGLDASSHSLAALAAAADLAAGLRAELIGLFVEDANLYNLAELPFAHEVQRHSAARRRFDRERVEAEWRLQAAQARRALREAAEQAEAKWSFQVVRGQVTPSLLAAALEADLLALGRLGWPISRRSRVGSTARAAATGARHSVLVTRQGREFKYPLLVTYDGTPAGAQALGVAMRLAQSSAKPLNVVLLAPDREQAAALRVGLEERLAAGAIEAGYHWLQEPDPAQLAVLIRASGDCVLVLGGQNPLLEADAVQYLLDATDCPMILVR
ncbi:MAG: universal stress protein [Candidatus Promineifilaceae bacterium]